MTDIEKNENIIELDDQELDEVAGGKKKKVYTIVKLTGSANIRKGPGLNFGIITALPSGSMLSYLKESKKDKRGVAWYKVNYNGNEAWVSSVYSTLA